MNDHVDDQLLAWVERCLAPEDRARVAAHLATCRRCRAAAGELAETVEALGALPGALRVAPARASLHWPAVWARVRAVRPAAGPSRKAWPQVSVYLSLVSTFVAFLAAVPGAGQAAPASVTAGVALGPQQTQAATVVFHAAGEVVDSTGTAGQLLSGAEPTLAGTEAIAPAPIPTPVPGPLCTACN